MGCRSSSNNNNNDISKNDASEIILYRPVEEIVIKEIRVEITIMMRLVFGYTEVVISYIIKQNIESIVDTTRDYSEIIYKYMPINFINTD